MTPASKHGLGRGLSALIPQRTIEEPTINSGVRQVQVAQIEPNPHQPRKQFTKEALDQLAASIREHGLIQPLVLKEINTPYGSRYQLIAGERRWRAAQRAGLNAVPAIIKGATPQQMLELALVENVQRADLNALEEAEAYRQLIQEFELTQEQVAQKVGKDRTTVSNALRLLKMPEALKEAVLNENISEGHARALMQIPEEAKQEKLLTRVVGDHLSVRQTEELVRRALAITISHRPKHETSADAKHKAAEEKHVTAIDTESIEQALRTALGTKVELTRSKVGGRLVIEFYSDEELEAIYEKLVG